MPDFSSHAESDPERRNSKARKIEALLSAAAPGVQHGRILEVGTGSGLIADYFARRVGHGLVNAIDVKDQRAGAIEAQFALYDGTTFPFEDEFFSLIISNHVIEHVGGRASQERHLMEMRRVIAKAGVVYLAAPSRWQVVEPHFRLALLSWIPRGWRDSYVRLARRGQRYDCNPLGHHEFESLAKHCGFRCRNLNLEALLVLARIEGRAGMVQALAARAPKLVRRFYRASPTMVYVLYPDHPNA